MKIQSTVTHTNGGLEQAFLEIANEDGLLNERDKERLLRLKSMPQNRTEVLNTYEVKEFDQKK